MDLAAVVASLLLFVLVVPLAMLRRVPWWSDLAAAALFAGMVLWVTNAAASEFFWLASPLEFLMVGWMLDIVQWMVEVGIAVVAVGLLIHGLYAMGSRNRRASHA